MTIEIMKLVAGDWVKVSKTEEEAFFASGILNKNQEVRFAGHGFPKVIDYTELYLLNGKNVTELMANECPDYDDVEGCYWVVCSDK